MFVSSEVNFFSFFCYQTLKKFPHGVGYEIFTTTGLMGISL